MLSCKAGIWIHISPKCISTKINVTKQTAIRNQLCDFSFREAIDYTSRIFLKSIKAFSDDRFRSEIFGAAGIFSEILWDFPINVADCKSRAHTVTHIETHIPVCVCDTDINRVKQTVDRDRQEQRVILKFILIY